MKQSFPDLPDWSFEINEVSNGVYRVVGRDAAGRTVEVSGLDPDDLIQRSKTAAHHIVAAVHGHESET
jgi:hypothetical protein